MGAMDARLVREGLKRHNAEEIARFSDFLPRLYKESISSPPRG
ncbi:MAG: hypothetical protein PHP28_02400 [Actinomycetota bacterium]|nr:hypothetical protein [Actinomycetota bacterium]MDD5666777.1 hypothetical protein [Actinomycetota bacterium]